LFKSNQDSFEMLLGRSRRSLPLTILALSVLKPCLGDFLDLKLGIPQSGCALSKKFFQALAKSLTASCKHLADKAYCQASLFATSSSRTLRSLGLGLFCLFKV